jgi:hypothetical protein
VDVTSDINNLHGEVELSDDVSGIGFARITISSPTGADSVTSGPYTNPIIK